jgi:hypothetical protein
MIIILETSGIKTSINIKSFSKDFYEGIIKGNKRYEPVLQMGMIHVEIVELLNHSLEEKLKEDLGKEDFELFKSKIDNFIKECEKKFNVELLKLGCLV